MKVIIIGNLSPSYHAPLSPLYFVHQFSWTVSGRKISPTVAITASLKKARNKLAAISDSGHSGFIEYSKDALKDTAQFFV